MKGLYDTIEISERELAQEGVRINDLYDVQMYMESKLQRDITEIETSHKTDTMLLEIRYKTNKMEGY